MWYKKRNVFLVMIFTICLLFGLPNEARGSQLLPLVLDDSTERANVYVAIEMLKDRNKEWSAEEVASAPLSEQFLPADEVEQKSGFFETGTWIRFEVVNESSEDEWLLEFAFPLIHEIRLYDAEESGVTELFQGGSFYPYHDREIDYRYFVYKLAIEPGETKTYYAFAAGGGDLHPPINIWKNEAFIGKIGQEYTLLGMFYGIVFVMIIYNLFLYVSLRLRSYLYYVIAISCTLMGKVSINGLGFQYLWPDYPMWNTLSTSFWVSLACIFILIFSRNFLEADQHVPAFRKWTYVWIAFNCSSIFILFASPFVEFLTHYVAQYMMMISALGTFLTVLMTAFICLKRGARQARFYIAGWLIFLTGVSITILERAVVLPYSMLTEYAGQAALTAEVVLLSLALADKINIIRREKEMAEEHAIESQAQSIRNLEKADRLKDEFLAVTSHELRTPLYGMIGIAESLHDGIAGSVSRKMKEQLSMVIKSGQRLTHLLNDILDFSKLKHQSLDLHRKPVDVKGVVDLVCAISTPLLKGKPIRLVNRLDGALPRVWADENRLQQIMYNLLSNAIKYTDEGEIVIHAFQNGDWLAIEVTDTGRGIAQRQLEVMFLPFQQGDASLDRRAGGTGIGLSIAKRLVDLHDGKLEVDTLEGEGSTFRVLLPLHQGQAEERTLVAATLESSPQAIPVAIKGLDKTVLTFPPESLTMGLEVGKNRPKVLIADDEPVNIQVLTNQLTLAGYEILTAIKGDEVFRILKEQKIDLLILDIMMPLISGYEVCRRLRETYSLMELPILMLTAKNQLQDKLAAFEVGANDYLVKPCEKQELLSRVRTLVRVKTLNQALSEMNLQLEEKVEARTQALEAANLGLNQSNEKLRAISASRRDLLANIAHELGGPVTLVHGYMQSIQEGIITNDDAHYQQLVLDKVNVLSRLIDDLFDLSKLEAGQASLNLKRLRLDVWLDQVNAHSEFAVLQNERQFVWKPLDSSFRQYVCQIDVDRMDQVFMNLISNAIKHTMPKSGIIAVEVTLTESSELFIRVKDNGQGIPEDELPNIFERFYREQQPSQSTTPSGTGLGLAIVQQIIRGHEGEVWAESKRGEGADICFTLPVTLME